jgi:hypothetical protein
VVVVVVVSNNNACTRSTATVRPEKMEEFMDDA